MTRAEFEDLLWSLSSGRGERRYGDVAAHFADDVFYSDANDYAFTDRRSLLQFFADDEGYEQSCVFHNSVFDETRQLGAAEYTYEGTYCYHGTVWITLAGDKIASWREYQHRSDLDWNEFWDKRRTGT